MTAWVLRMATLAGLILPGPAVLAQSAIPFKREAQGGAIDFSRVGLALILCLAVFGLIVYLLRRHLPVPGKALPGARRVKVLETQRLGPRALLHVVQFGEREYLIAQNEQGLTRLASTALSRPAPEPATMPGEGQHAQH